MTEILIPDVNVGRTYSLPENMWFLKNLPIVP
jgi:hypothetical protein